MSNERPRGFEIINHVILQPRGIWSVEFLIISDDDSDDSDDSSSDDDSDSDDSTDEEIDARQEIQLSQYEFLVKRTWVL